MKTSKEQLLDRARSVRDLAKDKAHEAEQNRRLSRDVITAIGASGVLGWLAPAEFGGEEEHIDGVVEFCSIVGEGCMSTAWVIGLLSVHNWMAGLFSANAQRDVFNPRNSRVISATFSPKGRAKPVEMGYVLDGTWPFLSGCHHASWIIVGAICPPMGQSDRPTPKVFIVPQRSYEILDTWHVSGMRGTGSCDVRLTNQFVHQDYSYDLVDLLNGTTSAPGKGTSRNANWPMAPVVAFSGVGTAFGGARRAIQLYGERLTQFNASSAGPGAPPGGGGARQSAIVRYADLRTRLFMVECLIKQSIENWKQKSSAGMVSLQDRADARAHCMRAVKECRELVSEILDSMGSRAQYEDHEAQRIARDVATVYSHVLLDFDGSNEVVGRLLLGMPHNQLLI